MDTISLLLSFVFGTIIGSFLNVVAFRYNTGFGLNGRSKCLSCAKTLMWYELVPIFSFISQKGACRKCKSRISWQYPLVEFFAGLLFVFIFIKFPPVSLAAGAVTAFYLLITGILVVITVYDIKHKIIPDALSYAFAAIAFVGMFFIPASGSATGISFHIPFAIDLLAGPLCALPFALLWLVSRDNPKGEWMGLGDAKLMLGIGWTLGFVAAVSAVVLAFWIGAAVSVIWMVCAVSHPRHVSGAPVWNKCHRYSAIS
jgi:prepilin signal peptidase PulO-like enzyme (type II secretory pathway)